MKIVGAALNGQLFFRHPIGFENTIPSPKKAPNISHTRLECESILDTKHNIH
jgi:hypothetical protein